MTGSVDAPGPATDPPAGTSPGDRTPPEGVGASGRFPEVLRSDLAGSIADGVIVVAVTVLAWSRRRSMPRDGWFFDDAWQAFGAARSGVGDLWVTGQTQPVYNAALWAWVRLFGEGEASLVTPARLAGVLGPALLYLVLRRFGAARSVGTLGAVSLAVVTIHVTYSGRVKVYTIELIVVLALMLALPRLARRRWSPVTAAGWVVGALLLSGASSFLLIATATAGVVLVLHPAGDRWVRAAAVAGQAVGSGAMLAATRTTLDIDGVSGHWGSNGGYIALRPLRGLPVRLDTHGRRVVEALVDQHSWVVRLVLVAAVFGLVLTAWRGPHPVVGRFLLATAGLAVVGSVLERVPFGTLSGGDTRRASIWLVPAVAFGFAATLGRLRGLVGRAPVGRAAFDVAVLLAATLLVVATADVPRGYARAGGRAAIERAVAEAGREDEVWFARSVAFQGGLYGDERAGIRATPEELVGFAPDFDDPRFHDLPFGPIDPALVERARGAPRVLVVWATSFTRGAWGDQLERIAVTLTLLGFEPFETVTIESGSLVDWRRP